MAILGRRGSGKSATARGLVEGELHAGHRTCIIDPKGDWWGLRLDADGVTPAFDIPIFGGEHGDVVLRPEMGEDLGRLVATHDLSCVVDLSLFSISDMRRFMRAFAESLYEHNRNPLTLVVDEADQLAPQSVPAEMATLLHRMDRLVRMGRKRGLWMWMITQRPAVLNKNLLTQVETLIAMQTTGKTDREAVAGWMEAHSHEGARGVMDTLAKLSVGEGWVWSAGADFLERIRFPMFRTYDSSRTPKHGEVVDAVSLPPIDMDAVKAMLATVPEAEQVNAPQKSAISEPSATSGIKNSEIAGCGSSDIRRLAQRQEAEKLRANLDAMEKRALRAEELISGMLMAQKNFQTVWMEAGEMWGLVHAYAFGADQHLVANGWESPRSIVNDDLPSPEFRTLSEIPGSSAVDTAAAPPAPGVAAVKKSPKPKQDALPLPEGATLNAAALQIASLLKAIAPDDLPWTDVLVLLGFRPGSGWIRKSYKQLIDLGYMSAVEGGNSSRVVATDHCCNDEAIPLGMWPSPDEVRAIWREKLRGPGGTIATFLAEVGATEAEGIGAGISMSPTAGWFRKGLKDALASNIIRKDGRYYAANPLLVD